MKKFIWKIRYMLEVRKRSGAPYGFAWEAAHIATDDWLEDEWWEWAPEDAANEEMSYWDAE